MAAPKYLSDGFRNERCNRCGDVIGYAFFDAREYVMGPGKVETVFTHRERDYSFPSWCEWKER
jgi:hypothetical protein